MYITDFLEYKDLYDLVHEAKEWTSKPAGSSTFYLDWRAVFSGDCAAFWNGLSALSCDPFFYILDLDDQPGSPHIEKSYGFTGHYPGIKFSADVTMDVYSAEINREVIIKNYFGENERADGRRDAVDTMRYTSAYAVFPRSKKWYLYGEYQTEIARLITFVGLPRVAPPYDFINAEEAAPHLRECGLVLGG